MVHNAVAEFLYVLRGHAKLGYRGVLANVLSE
jgi:hypothetical protein